MKELLLRNIHWDEIGPYSKDTYKFNIGNAVYYRDTKTLELEITLNFIIPFYDYINIKRHICDSIEDVDDVIFKFIYIDVVIDEKDIIRLFLLYLCENINGSYVSLIHSIKTDGCEIDENTIRLDVAGDFAMKSLNENVASDLAKALAENFNILKKIEFVYNEEKHEKIREDIKKSSQNEMINALKEVEKQVNEEKDRHVKADGSSTQKNQGVSAKGGNYYVKKRGNKKLNLPVNGDILVGGEAVHGEPLGFDKLKEGENVVVEGIFFSHDSRKINDTSYVVTLYITDKSSSIPVKNFLSIEKWEELEPVLKKGDMLRIKGMATFDTYLNFISVKFTGIQKIPVKRREDTCKLGKRVELHAHTKMSSMDGLNDVETLVKTSAYWGHPAVAITDHGVVQSFPDAAKVAKKLASDKNNPINIKIIYGLEGYVFDDSDCVNDDGSIDYKKKNTNHIILLAATQQGLKNIYKLVSISHLDYFYKKPRLPKSLIAENREGIIIGSACEAGEVFRSVLEDEPKEKQLEIAQFYDYLEIQPIINNQFLIDKGIVNDDEGLRALNRKVLQLGKELNKPVVATTDAHYDEPESAIYRNILMAGIGFKDAENGRGLFMRTTDEMLEEFSYLGEEEAYKVVIENSNLISDMISPDILPVPKGKYPPKIDGAEEILRESCMKKAYEIYGNPLPKIIEERLLKELNSIIDHGYAVMYVSAQMLVQKSLEDGYLVGSRGSVGSSFAATMAGITEVNPLDPHYICPECKYLEWGDMEKYDCGIDMPYKKCPNCGAELHRDGFTIPFATFLGFDGDKEPDIDLNFAGEYQATAHKYVGKIFGEENVYKAGTVSTVAQKTAYGYVRKFSEETNKGLNPFEINRLSECCTGVKKTTGQHPGGIIIVPDDHDIYEFCPVQRPANDVKSDIVTTHFDYHKIDENLLKLDILGHNVPSMIRQLQDMTGVDPLKVDLTDRKVLSIFNGIEALNILDKDYKFKHGSYAIPEFGTSFVRQMLDDTKPDKFADLVRISGFSHGTDVWLNNAQDYIKSGIATMREVISTRDDIMNYLILKGIENKTAFQIMEDVRKNRPLKEDQLKIMKEHNVPQWYVDSCIKIQYMFPRAHAVAYVMMSFRLAWYKVYYPKEFYATYFSSVVDNFNADIILAGKRACLDRIDEISSMADPSQRDKDQLLIMEVAYEMYARGYEFEKPVLGKSQALKFQIENDKILLPFVALSGIGENAAINLYNAYCEKSFGSIEDAVKRAGLNKVSVGVLKDYGVFTSLPETDQLSFFM